MRASVEWIARPVAVVLATLLVAPPAFARTVRCESKDYRYRFCSVDTYGDVELKNERSRSSCHYGRTWGYDHRGIWVDRGCRADFAVDEGRHRDDQYSRYNRYDHYDRHDDRGGSDKTAAAVAGAAVGVALIAALVNSKNKSRNRSDDDVPSWILGKFEGYNTLYEADVELEVSPSGSVTGRVPHGRRVHGTYANGRIELSDAKFDVERKGSGFILTQVDNPDNVIVYHRDR